MAAVVVKVQVSRNSGDGTPRVLVYNEDRSIRYEGDADPALIAQVGSGGKVFCLAHFGADGLLDLWPDHRVPDPGW